MKTYEEMIQNADVKEKDESKKECEHQPGQFLGYSFSPNYERYKCAKCGEEISWRINR